MSLLCSWLDVDFVEGAMTGIEGEGEENGRKERDPQADESESPKQIYNDLEETCRQLDSQSRRCSNVLDLFSTELIEKRFKIQKLCETLIFKYPPKAYGFCAREKLWRFVYYDAIQRARRMQREKDWCPLELAFIKAHIEMGISKLNTFVSRIQDCDDFIANPLLSHPSTYHAVLMSGNDIEKDLVQRSRERDITIDGEADQKKMVDLLTLCFVNMGDLYRYLKEINGRKDAEMASNCISRAEEWYTQAFLMKPKDGLSMNQLGNIHIDRNWGVDCTYYLLYSCLMDYPYEGAFMNLKQTLESKMVKFVTRPAVPEPSLVELLCYDYVKLVFQLLFEDTKMNCEKLFGDVLQKLHTILATNDPDVDEALLYKFAAICVLIVWKLQAINSPHISPAVAFALSVFFTLVTHLGSILEGLPRTRKRVISERSEASSVASGHPENEPEGEAEEADSNPKAKKKQTKGRGRGPRFRSSSIPSLQSFDEDSEEEDDDEDDDYSEDEENRANELWSDSDTDTEDSEEEHSEEEPTDCLAVEKKSKVMEVKAFSSTSSSKGSDPSSSGSGNNSQRSLEGLKQDFLQALEEKEEEEETEVSIEDFLAVKERVEPLLAALTPFIRWLQTAPAVKDALAANAEKIFLEKLCAVLTILSSKNWGHDLSENEDGGRGKASKKIAKDWDALLSTGGKDGDAEEDKYFRFQLPEDRSMLGLPLIRRFVEGLVIEDGLTNNDQLAIRIGRFVSFGIWMNNTDSFSMMYCEEDRKFFVPTAELLKHQMRAARLRQLLRGDLGSEKQKLERLARAYKSSKHQGHGQGHGQGPRSRRGGDRDRPRGGERSRGGGRRRRREDHPSGDRDRDRDRPRRIRRGRHANSHANANGTNGHVPNGRSGHRRNIEDKPVCIIVDLDAILKHMERIKKLTCNKEFVIYVPHSVFESLDMMKDSTDTKDERTLAAQESYAWIDAALKRSHPGIRIMKNNEKQSLNTNYPKHQNDIEVWEYYDMLECCNHLMTTVFNGQPYDYIHRAFGDHRDRYSVLYLSGNETLLDTQIKRSFDPIKIARSLPGVFVDCITEYPAIGTRTTKTRAPSGRKWQTSGKNKG